MLDYHLHLWPHGQRDTAPTLEQVAAYCESARAAGVHEVALTEHLFRFRQADRLLRGFWDDEPDAALRASMATTGTTTPAPTSTPTWSASSRPRTPAFPSCSGSRWTTTAGRMDDVAALLAGYPFDVLLGSVHWIGTWRFDDIDDARLHGAVVDARRRRGVGRLRERPSRSSPPPARATCSPTPTS